MGSGESGMGNKEVISNSPLPTPHSPLPMFSLFRRPFERRGLLFFQQPAFALDAPAIAAEFAVLANDAMTGRDEGRRIGRAGSGDGAGGGRPPYARGDLAVRSALGVGNSAQRFPDPFLKSRPLHVERQVGMRLLARQMREKRADLSL